MQRLLELCNIIIQNNLGELAAQIFVVLARHGRVTETNLRTLTKLRRSRLQAGLSVLVQYHIALYYAGNDYEPSYFQVDWHAAYVLVRTDKIHGLVSERHGEHAGKIVDQVLQLGVVSVGDLAEGYTMDSAVRGNNGTNPEKQVAQNGVPNGSLSKSAKTPAQLHNTLITLLEHGFLIKLGPRSFIPHADLQQLAEDTVKGASFKDGKISGPKTKIKFEKYLNAQKRKWQEEDEFSSRRDTTTSRPAKRLKGANGRFRDDFDSSEEEDGDGDSFEPRLPDGMVVRVNYHKCIMALRTQRLERTASRYLGPVSGAVYGALLRVLERKERATRNVYKINDLGVDDEDGDDDHEEDDEEDQRRSRLPTATDMEILAALDDSLDLTTAFASTNDRSNQANGNGETETKEEEPEEANENHDSSDSEEDVQNGLVARKRYNERLEHVAMHVELLAEHAKEFCIRSRNTGKTSVDIISLTHSLIQSELEAMIDSRHGPFATRIVRILRQYGKLEEKQIAYMCLKRLKEVRQVLANLQGYTLVDTQELPKDSTRQPNRNTYLWFFDAQRVSDMFLQHTYQGMARILQRMHSERLSGVYRTAVDKAESDEVKGRENELLAKHERDIVKRWRDNEERMLIQLSRMDDVVALFRDFTGNDTSLDT